MLASPSRTRTDLAESRVVILADDAELAARLRTVVENHGLDAGVEFEAVDEFLRYGTSDELGAIVVGLVSEGNRLLGTYSAVRSAFPDLPLVAVWPADERRESKRALKAGADAVVSAAEIESALGPALDAVRLGLVCVSRRKVESTASGTLSNREKQVLGMLIMGFSNAEIGQRLYLAESTVKSHLSSAYMKLGVRSRKDAAALILDPEEGLGTAVLAISAS